MCLVTGSYTEDEPTEVARLFVGHDYGSVNSKRAHPPPPPPGICHFVVEKPQCPTVGRLVYAKTPWWGFKKVCKCPNLLKTTPKLHFPVSELQVPYLQEICNNLIKMH